MQDLQTESGEPTEKSEKKSVKLPKFGENLSGDEEDDYSDGEGMKIMKYLEIWYFVSRIVQTYKEWPEAI